MAASSQSFEKHTRWDPLFHFFSVPVAILTLLWLIYHAYKNFNDWTAWQVIVAIAAILKIRLYALKVQDRVIRLEERVRLATLVTPELRSRIHELTPRQLVALRFCGDEELPALAARALSEKLDGKAIKSQIKNWRADEFRV